MKKLSLLAALFTIGAFILTSCGGGGSSSPAQTFSRPEKPNQVDPEVTQQNTALSGKPAADLDTIFSNTTLGETTIKMRRSEWNELLENFDYFHKNENCVKVISYTYKKGSNTWVLPTVGIRLRGNTSRFRPQGKDFPTDKSGHKKANADWSQDYYNYAKNCDNNDYRQAHFKVDFEEFAEECKMASCMKGVALKRMDPSCTREIMCYDLFHSYGIWTAPRASHTTLKFEFIEDYDTAGKVIDDITGITETTTVNFGVYEMFEEVNKQSLKARSSKNLKKDKNNNEITNNWKNNNGNLWKISGGDLTSKNFKNVGVEDVEIKFNAAGKRVGTSEKTYSYDLKTNKTSLSTAKAELKGFIDELNALPKTASTTEEQNKIKAFYEKWFDMDLFLKTYAINILVGMDDDYWGNANNYYLYFAEDKDENRKVWFIPFDYDNTLGNSIKKAGEHGGNGDGFKQNPLEWGRGQDRPLMDRMLLVPEFKGKFINYLKEVSSETSEWTYAKCSAKFNQWKNLVKDKLNSSDLKGGHISTTEWIDQGGWTPSGYYLTQNPNIYDATRENILRWVGDIETITFNLNGGKIGNSTDNIPITLDASNRTKALSELVDSPKKDNYIFMGWTKTQNGEDYKEYATANTVYARWKALSEIHDLFIYEKANSATEGITVGILNVPSNAYVREFFINGIKVGQTEATGDGDWYTTKKLPAVRSNEWAYPYTEANKNYEIYIVYKNKSWGDIARTKPVTIKAEGGKGAFKATTKPVYTTKNNVFKFTTKPVLQIGSDKTITCPATTPDGWKDEWNECYIWDIKKKGWGGDVSWNKLDPSLPDLNLLTATNHDDVRIIPDNCRNTDLMFQLYFKYAPEGINEYWLILYDFETVYFKVSK